MSGDARYAVCRCGHFQMRHESGYTSARCLPGCPCDGFKPRVFPEAAAPPAADKEVDKEAVAILAEDIFARTIASVAAHSEPGIDRLCALAWDAAESFVAEKQRRQGAGS